MGRLPPSLNDVLAEEFQEDSIAAQEELWNKGAVWLFPDGQTTRAPGDRGERPSNDPRRPGTAPAHGVNAEQHHFAGFEQGYAWIALGNHQDPLQVQLREVVRHLWAPPSKPGASKAKQIQENIVAFVRALYVEACAERRSSWTRSLQEEAKNVMHELVSRGLLRVRQDLVLSYMAFQVTIVPNVMFDEKVVNFQINSVVSVLESALAAAPQEEAEAFRQGMLDQVRTGEADFYGYVDVRAWNQILTRLLKPSQPLDYSVLQGEQIKNVIDTQLNSSETAWKWVDSKKQAARLISEMRVVNLYTSEDIRGLFNSIHMPNRQRKELLSIVLKHADRELKQDVLQQIDEEDVEIADRRDEDVRLIQELLRELREDIRACHKTFYKMQVDWMIDRDSGVIVLDELTPDEIFDHIELDVNFGNLLKEAVKCYLQRDKRFEAAKMLVKRASRDTQVYDARRNDKQLNYLLSLFKDQERLPDRFGPIEPSFCMVIPTSQTSQGRCKVLRIGASEGRGQDQEVRALAELTRATLNCPFTALVGMAWFWRCFEPSLDFWVKARCLALVCNRVTPEGEVDGILFTIVDFIELDKRHEEFKAQVKHVVRQIMEAQHLLKITNGMDHRSLAILQRALADGTPSSDLGRPEDGFPMLMPVIDFALPAAFIFNTRPSDPLLRLRGMVSLLLRIEICTMEATSNFERTILRESQEHYALTQAWAPMVLLHALAAYDDGKEPVKEPVISNSALAAMIMQIDTNQAPQGWDVAMKDLPLSDSPEALTEDPGDIDMEDVPFDENPWENPKFLESDLLPRPKGSAETIRRAFAIYRPRLGDMMFDNELIDTYLPLFHGSWAAMHLEDMYAAFKWQSKNNDDEVTV